MSFLAASELGLVNITQLAILALSLQDDIAFHSPHHSAFSPLMTNAGGEPETLLIFRVVALRPT